MIPFLKIPVQKIIPKQRTVSKTQELLIDLVVMEILDKAAIKKVEYHVPGQCLSNILLV